MRKLLFISAFLIACVVSGFAQYQAHAIKIEKTQDKDSVYIMLTENQSIKYKQGKGKFVNYEAWKLGLFADPMIQDKHFFGANLTANTHHTHNATNKNTTINDMGIWQMISTGGTGSMYLDALAVTFSAPDIQLDASDDLILLGGPSNVSRHSLRDDGVYIENDSSLVYIKDLARDDTEDDVIGISSVTGLLVIKDASILETKTPASASAPGVMGDIAWDISFFYVCVGTNTWKRVAISTW